MTRIHAVAVLFLLGILSGCGKSTEATTGAQPVPPLTTPPLPEGFPAGAMEFEKEPPIQMPQLTEDLMDQVKVEVLEVDSGPAVQGASSLAARGSVVGIRVKVTNNLGNVRIDVGPHRFVVLDADGNGLPLTVSSMHSPSLDKMYLGPNESVEGWLSYRAPGDSTRLILKCDLRRPSIQIPLDAAP